MPTYIALLRAINVGGRNMVAMADLRDLLTSLGFPNSRSLLQSGNLVFQGGRRQGALLERLLESETEKRLAVSVDYFVCTANEWDSIIACNPFTTEATTDPNHLVLMCLKQAPNFTNMQALQSAIRGPEIVHAAGKHLYIVYPAGIGKSKLTNTMIERKLGARGTARNWNTVLKLAQTAKA